MSHIAQLLYGSNVDVIYILDNNELNNNELRAALQNAFKRIDYLESVLQKAVKESGT